METTPGLPTVGQARTERIFSPTAAQIIDYDLGVILRIVFTFRKLLKSEVKAGDFSIWGRNLLFEDKFCFILDCQIYFLVFIAK